MGCGCSRAVRLASSVIGTCSKQAHPYSKDNQHIVDQTLCLDSIWQCCSRAVRFASSRQDTQSNKVRRATCSRQHAATWKYCYLHESAAHARHRISGYSLVCFGGSRRSTLLPPPQTPCTCFHLHIGQSKVLRALPASAAVRTPAPDTPPPHSHPLAAELAFQLEVKCAPPPPQAYAEHSCPVETSGVVLWGVDLC